MKLIRAATLTVSDIASAIHRYTKFLDYTCIDQGQISADLASSWGTANTAGLPYAIMQPSSGANIYLRFIEQPAVPGYKALRSFGWNAIELCVENVLTVNQRMQDSPFEIIGPPKKIEGLDAIFPMQVKGPDDEIVYFTQINSDLPAYKLPRAASLIDKLFILVMGCADMDAAADWMQRHAGLSMGREMEIVYTMIAKAYDSPMDALHRICTLVHEDDVFLELDEYPEAATPRPHHEGMLVPGCAIGTLWHPQFDRLPGPWITPPIRRGGPIYKDKLVATLKTPDGALVEMVQG